MLFRSRSEEVVPMYQRFLRSGVESSPERLARASEYLRHAEQRVLLVQRVAQQPAALALLCPTRRASYALPDFSVGLLTGAPVLRPIPRVPTYRRGWLWGTVGAVASTIAIVAGLSWYAHPPTCPRCTIQ